MPIDFAGFAYAFAVAAGGAYGYYKAGSISSIVSGLLFGGALAYGAYQVSQDPSNYSGQLTTTSVLTGYMGYRFYNSGKIMPGGVVCAISIIMLVRIALRASALIDRKV